MNIYVIPDTQSKEGVENPLIPVAHHICSLKDSKENRPDVVLHLGDHWDFPSLGQYDKGKKSHRAKTYLKDIRAGNKSMQEFWDIIKTKWPRWKSQCRWELLRGNHENRRVRALDYGPDELVDLINEFPMDDSNWSRVSPFLKVVTIGGVDFCHYFTNNNSPRPLGSARMILNKRHTSSIAGHQQCFDYHEQLAGKKLIQSLIIGACYFHDEEYKPQSNHHWRGTVLLKNVKGGMFDFNRYTLSHLKKKYGR
jgi:hypothetical protein